MEGVIESRPCLAASRAASLIRLLRSAPLNPASTCTRTPTNEWDHGGDFAVAVVALLRRMLEPAGAY
eukprot:365941-Chlamydomonas_euryale.AAC.6